MLEQQTIDTVIDQCVPLLVDDGFTREEAISSLCVARGYATNILNQHDFQLSLERAVRHGDPKPVLKSLPFLKVRYNIVHLLEVIAKTSDSPSDATRYALRYLEIITESTGLSDFFEQVSRYDSSRTGDISPIHLMFLYIQKIQTYFPDLVEKLCNKAKPRHLVALASQLQHTEKPQNVRKVLQKITADARRGLPVTTVRRVNQYTGCCNDMYYWHTIVIGRRASHNYAVLSVNDTPVGSIKRHGDPSMLAWVTVQDDKNRFSLIKGGVYALKKGVTAYVNADIISVPGLEAMPIGYIPSLVPYIDTAFKRFQNH